MLDFKTLKARNFERCRRWHPKGVQDWDLNQWAVAVAGELGEALNVIKKINRHDGGLAGNKDLSREDLRAMLARELADVVIYLDLLAQRDEIDLGAAVKHTFNRKSEELGFSERL